MVAGSVGGTAVVVGVGGVVTAACAVDVVARGTLVAPLTVVVAPFLVVEVVDLAGVRGPAVLVVVAIPIASRLALDWAESL